MPPLAEVQKFIIWIFGSIAVFGCISTLIAFLVYEDKSTMKCDANDIKCKEEEQKKIAVSRNDNEILKIVSPTAIAVGVIVIILVRCWQQSSNRLSTQDPVDDAEPNAMYLGRPFDMGAPPSYNDALSMDIVLEAHGSYPTEAPPKYEEIISDQPEGGRCSRGESSDNAEPCVNVGFEMDGQGDSTTTATQNPAEAEVEDAGDADSHTQTFDVSADDAQFDSQAGCETVSGNRTASASDLTARENSPPRERMVFAQHHDSGLSGEDIDETLAPSGTSDAINPEVSSESPLDAMQSDETVDRKSGSESNSSLADSTAHPQPHDLNSSSVSVSPLNVRGSSQESN